MAVIQTPGARLSYSRTGRGPAVLIVQGAGAVGECWRPQIDALADRFTVLAFDNRGIGSSEILDGHLSVEAMAADALAILDAERIERFHLAGHSMGGLIAQEIALVAPRRVASLALLCTFVRGRQGARLTPSLAWTGLRMHVGTRAMRRRAFLELVMPAARLRQTDPAHEADRLQLLFGRDVADQPTIAMRQLRAMARYDVSDRLAQLRMPALIVSGAEDRIALPAYGRALARAIPGSRYVELEGAGHALTIHEAARVNNLLAGHFLEAGQEAQAVVGR